MLNGLILSDCHDDTAFYDFLDYLMTPSVIKPLPIPYYNNIQAGTSCHQCKKKHSNNELYFCTSHVKLNSTRACRKKYCYRCIKKYITTHLYNNHNMYTLEWSEYWICPACMDICTCARCKSK